MSVKAKLHVEFEFESVVDLKAREDFVTRTDRRLDWRPRWRCYDVVRDDEDEWPSG